LFYHTFGLGWGSVRGHGRLMCAFLATETAQAGGWLGHVVTPGGRAGRHTLAAVFSRTSY